MRKYPISIKDYFQLCWWDDRQDDGALSSINEVWVGDE